jgi:hypothetical protein
MKTATCLVLCLASLALVASARAADDPTGTWTWTVERGGQKRDMTLKLKLEGDKLTGSMPGRDNTETPIADATYKDGDIAFTVTREFNGNKFTIKYMGKVSGDSIKGKTEFERNGEKQSNDWEAKRSK